MRERPRARSGVILPSGEGEREILEESHRSTVAAQRLRGARAYASPAARAGEREPPQPESDSRAGIERMRVFFSSGAL